MLLVSTIKQLRKGMGLKQSTSLTEQKRIIPSLLPYIVAYLSTEFPELTIEHMMLWFHPPTYGNSIPRNFMGRNLRNASLLLSSSTSILAGPVAHRNIAGEIYAAHSEG